MDDETHSTTTTWTGGPSPTVHYGAPPFGHDYTDDDTAPGGETTKNPSFLEGGNPTGNPGGDYFALFEDWSSSNNGQVPGYYGGDETLPIDEGTMALEPKASGSTLKAVSVIALIIALSVFLIGVSYKLLAQNQKDDELLTQVEHEDREQIDSKMSAAVGVSVLVVLLASFGLWWTRDHFSANVTHSDAKGAGDATFLHLDLGSEVIWGGGHSSSVESLDKGEGGDEMLTGDTI